MSKKTIKVALAGNPNTGKTSLFNALTGMNQRVGNYPGITVDKKVGYFQLDKNTSVKLLDLPGTYSLNVGSSDEEVVLNVLSSKDNPDYPDALIFVADASNLKRNLYFFSQIRDLGIPMLLVLNMVDIVERKGVKVDIDKLSEILKTPVMFFNARKGKGISALKEKFKTLTPVIKHNSVDLSKIAPEFLSLLKEKLDEEDDYIAWLKGVQADVSSFLSAEDNKKIKKIISEKGIDIQKIKIKEAIERYKCVNSILDKVIIKNKTEEISVTYKIDKIITHKFFGYGVFFTMMLFLFQAIYSWSSIPMDFIDTAFSNLSSLVKDNLPPGVFTDLLTQGIIPGIGGIVIFIPQIAILFAFISVMEDTGYMSRVVFLMDKLMRKFGMSGKSILPLMSGMACAVPSIMSTRTIDNWRERLITILVTPFITCSARLPVYSIIIALIIPHQEIFGIFNLQGLVLMLMYFIGFIAALLSAFVAQKLLKIKKGSTLIIEMPSYKIPYYKNVGLDIIEKTKAFVFNAGKIILTISVVLWALASYGPGDKITNAKENIQKQYPELTKQELSNKIASYKLEHSYIGNFGRFIEPSIKPLGYDWKIGIAILSSFAAREVFVSTMSTIYAVGTTPLDGDYTILKKMKEEINPDTGKPIYNIAVGWSLLFFYAFAMQCTSTIAIVKKETNSWKWPIIQTVFMTGLAYISSYIIYQILK